jgi:hypothetical protein
MVVISLVIIVTRLLKIEVEKLAISVIFIIILWAISFRIILH